MFRANIFIKKFMFLFAFNLCKQINLFTKHIFANKDITIPYYIYSCFVRSSPLARPDVMPAGCPSGRSSATTNRGSCLPSFTILANIKGKPPQPAGEAACRISPVRLLPSPGTLLAVLHPLGGILHPGHRQGAHVSLLSAAGSLAPESKLQE